MLGSAYFAQNYASIICQGLIAAPSLYKCQCFTYFKKFSWEGGHCILLPFSYYVKGDLEVAIIIIIFVKFTDCCFMCGDPAWKQCHDCMPYFTTNATTPVYFCDNCTKLAHGQATKRDKHRVSDITAESGDLTELELLSVICIETSHYVCFTRSEDKWVFFDSYGSRISKGRNNFNVIM